MSRLWGERARTARGGRTTALRVLAVLVVGVVLTLTSFTRLTSLAGALTGDTFTDAINSWTAVYQKGPGTGEGSWSRTDGSDALDESSDLRLRIAFDIPADGLAGGDSLRYALPSGLWVGDGTQVAVFASDTVGDPDETSARVIGYAQVYGNVMTLVFNGDIASSNMTTQFASPDGQGATDAASAQLVTVPGTTVSGFVDLDFGFDRLSTDADGVASLRLSDWLTLYVTKAPPAPEPEPVPEPEPAAAEQSPEPEVATAVDATASPEPAPDDPTHQTAADAEAAPVTAAPEEGTGAGETPASAPAVTDAAAPATDAASLSQAAPAASEPAAAPAVETPATTEAPAPTDTPAPTDGTTAGTEDAAVTQVASAVTDTVTSTASDAPAPRALLRRAPAAANDGIDFSDYLTNGTIVQKKVNGKWTAATEFNDGDDVQVTIDYALPKGTVTTDSRTITYQVPQGIKPNTALTGRTVDENGEENGDYVIDTNGKVTVTFDKSFIEQGDLITGAVTFRGKVHGTGDQEKSTIHFGGAASDITVTKPVEEKNDIYAQKSGSLSTDHTTATYTVTIGSNKGTGDTVAINDAIDYGSSTGAKPTYQRDSFKIVKVDASGVQTPVSGHGPTWGDNGGKGVSFSVTGLPALGPNEKYVATYAMDMHVDANATTVNVGNRAVGTSGDHSRDAWGNVYWKQEQEVQKSGTFDQATGKISWRVTVNPNGRDVSGWTLVDALPAGCTLWGNYTVRGKNTGTLTTGGNYGDGEVRYTFPSAGGLSDAQKTDTYYVDFWTTAPASDGNVDNTAKVWETNGYFEGKTTVGVRHRGYDLAKTFSNERADGPINTETWAVNATLPDAQLTTFTYADTIQNAMAADGTDMGAESHYAYASELEDDFADRLRLVVDNYTEYRYEGASNPTYYYRSDDASQCGNTSDVTFTVTYRDAAGNVVAPTDSSTPVKSFTVMLGFADGHEIHGKSLVLDSYRTHVDTSSLSEGSTWTVKNTGSIADKTSTASHDITKQKTFEKQVLTKKKGQYGGPGTYQSGDATVSYDEMEGVLSYRLILNTSSSDNGTITITDTLPAGATLVDGSVKATFYENEYSSHSTNYAGTDFENGQKPTYGVVVNDDGTTTLTITITGYTYASSHPRVAVSYDVSVAGDPAWNDPMADTVSYANTAAWNGHTDSQNTTVKRAAKPATKTGTQLDKFGNPVELQNGNPVVDPSNAVRYYVDINTAGRDLNPQEDALTLTDVMQDADKYDPQLDISSVKLYAYSITADHHLGGLISEDRYSVQYDQATATLTVMVPDGLACVLVYDYQIDKDAVVDNAVVKNACTLDGSWSSASDVSLRESSSSAAAYHKRITLRKVDSDNYQKPLNGSMFTLERWDTSTHAWVMENDAVKPQDGSYTWDLGGTTPALTANALYRLVETAAPGGYALDQTPHYFVWMDAQNNKDASYNTSGASSASKPDNTSGVSKEQITFFKNAGGTLYVPNTYTRLTVKKVWANEDGSAAAAPADANVTVELRRYTRETDLDQTCAVHVHAEGSASWAQPVDLGVLDIQRGTPLTLKINMWGGVAMIAYVDGEEYESFTTANDGYTLTIDGDKLTGGSAEVDIKVTSAGNSPNGVDVTSYTKPGTKDSKHVVVDTATLDASNGWTRSWENLPTADEVGDQYRYEVIETACSVPGTTVSYAKTGGAQTGTVTVTNTLPHHEEETGYTLPATGGRGVTGLYAGAVAIACASLAGIAALRRRRGHVR